MKVRLGVRTLNGTIAEAAWEIRSGVTPARIKLLEIGFTLAAATATTIGLGRPQVIGNTPGGTYDFLPVDPNDVVAANLVLSATSWAATPTVPLAFFTRIALPNTIGTGVVWPFPEGIVIPVSSSLVLWNITANSVLDAWALVEI